MNGWFALAGVLGAMAFVVHTFVGGRYAVVPLLAETNLPRAARGLNYLCWHIVTMLLFVMAATALAGAAAWVAADAVAVVGIIAAGISIIAVIAARKVGIAPWRFPASYVFGAMALCVVLGLWG